MTFPSESLKLQLNSSISSAVAAVGDSSADNSRDERQMIKITEAMNEYESKCGTMERWGEGQEEEERILIPILKVI